MAATSTKGTVIQISNGSITATKLSPTAIVPSPSAGAATKITVANTLTAGALVVMPSTTGYPALNNKSFSVAPATTTDFTINADTFGQAGPMSSNLSIDAYPSSALIALCLSQFDIAASTTDTTDTSTFCSTGSIPGATTPGTITLSGYVDDADVGFQELIKAGDDNKPRVLDIKLPGTLGHLIGVISFSEMSFTVPLSGAVGYSITGTQNVSIKYSK